MVWYNYVAAFFAGLFLANSVPHFIHGMSGKKYPTPFGDPPFRGLSSPPVNVLWASFNLVVGSLLAWSGHFPKTNIWAIMLSAAGIGAMGFIFARERRRG